MNLPVRLRSAAESDVVAHARYLEERSPLAASRFLDAFDAALALIGHSPGIGGRCRFQNPLFEGIRAWPIGGFKSHLIFYRLLADEIEVVRVVHGARDLGLVFGEGGP